MPTPTCLFCGTPVSNAAFTVHSTAASGRSLCPGCMSACLDFFGLDAAERRASSLPDLREPRFTCSFCRRSRPVTALIVANNNPEQLICANCVVATTAASQSHSSNVAPTSAIRLSTAAHTLMLEVDIPGPDIAFPQRCVCCSSKTDQTVGVKKSFHTIKASVQVPLCLTCRKHCEVYISGGTALGCSVLAISLVLVLVLMASIASSDRAPTGALVFLGLVIVGAMVATALLYKRLSVSVLHEGALVRKEVAAKMMMMPTCFRPDDSSAEIVRVFPDVITMSFRGTYAFDVISLNPGRARWAATKASYAERDAIIDEALGSVRRFKHEEMVHYLGQLCRAYAENDRAEIDALEPLGTQIGEELDRRGAITAMREVWMALENRPGAQALATHWDGIAQWRPL
jgi:hypothetical protein